MAGAVGATQFLLFWTLSIERVLRQRQAEYNNEVFVEDQKKQL
jgi:hypothetical protein